MEKEINLLIKKGVYCSWCANLLERTLKQHFKIKEIEINILKDKVRLITYNKADPKIIIHFLKKRGYLLTEERV